MTEQRSRRLRILSIQVVLVAFAAAIGWKLFTIQLVEGEQWMARAVKVATSVREVVPDRGHIYSEDGRLLATSVPEYGVYMDLRADGLTNDLFGAHLDSLCWNLANLFADRSAQQYAYELRDARSRGERYFMVKRRCDHVQMTALKKFPLFREGRFKSGLIITKTERRIQPFGRYARRTIGKPAENGKKAFGLEGGFDPFLRGVTGHRLERRLSGDVWMPVDDGEGQAPVPGCDVHTTIDMNLQDVADAELAAQLRKNGAHHGCVVVMETGTGYIKAISNLTRANDSTYVDDENYAVGHATEPGSTFKTASLMVALEDGRISLDDEWDTHGGVVRFHDRKMKDSHDGGYGTITLGRALEVSSNTAISQAINKAYRAEPQRFIEGLRKLGIDKPLGLRIPGEPAPTLRGPEDKKYWSGVSLPWMSVGYEVMVTPLQTLAFYNAIANNGRLMQPQFVRSVTRHGKEVQRFEPVTLNPRICSDATLGKIRELLENVVDTGTATNLQSAHFTIAGKTGTAQIAQGGNYKQHGVSYQASFVGYFPAEAPKYTCIVVVYGPTMRGIYGNVVAGPVFEAIANKIYANRLELQTGLAEVKEVDRRMPVTFSGHAKDLIASAAALHVPLKVTDEAEWVGTTAGDSMVIADARALPGDAIGMVPNVLGMGLKDALFILENRGLRVRVLGSGMVKKQSLRPGSRCFNGSAITIELNT